MLLTSPFEAIAEFCETVRFDSLRYSEKDFESVIVVSINML
jgi:hypothetical protein